MLQTTIDLTPVDQWIEQYGTGKESLIPLLQKIQSHYRYLPEEVLRYLCDRTQNTPSEVIGVSTFYSQFRHEPVGEHMINVCTGTACHVKGAGLVHDAFLQHLGITAGKDTDQDKKFTVQKVACLGCCTLAPVVQIDQATYGHLRPSMIPDVMDDFLHRASEKTHRQPAIITPEQEVGEIRIGLGSCCQAQGSAQVRDAVNEVLAETQTPARVKRVGCVGMCHQTPLLELVEKGQSYLYAKVQPEDVRSIILDRFQPTRFTQRWGNRLNRWLERLWSDEIGDASKARFIEPREQPVCSFLSRQVNLATEFCGEIDPKDTEEYRSYGGFQSLHRAMELTPQQLIDEVQASGLRGRGGGGFPTYRKWEMVAQAESDQKYIICNGDEGDPGAFMDRMLLESFPYRILEGMIIAARAVGATQGYLYIRAEYPLAVQRINEALDACYREGYLGDDILGSGFSLDLKVKEGAGAFVCGEETALLESIEGRRGMPQLRPPYPSESGLYGKPTLVNNVESYALVSWILKNGGRAFGRFGTLESRGTKVFALAGKIERGGLIEVPMGITMREIVEEIGGGVAGGKTFKAVQIGGPSGGCVPAELADISVDFESLSEVGAIMGSGGLVVLDEDDCMVDIARYFLQFTQEQSCGKCTFCRVGTRRMLDILDRICAGEGKKDDLEKLESLAQSITLGSLCGLGKTAPNPILSTLKFFRREYEAHLEGRCPAGKCPDLIEYVVNDKCTGCTLCAQTCPVDAVASVPYRPHRIDPETCTRCNACREICPYEAIEVH